MRIVEMMFRISTKCRVFGDPLQLRIVLKLKLDRGFMEYTEAEKEIKELIGEETTVEEACDKIYAWLKAQGYYNVLVEVVGVSPSHLPIRCVQTDNPLFVGWRL